jgi:hypothetical protein
MSREEGLTLKDFWKTQFSILEAVRIIVLAWQEVSVHCFNTVWRLSKCGVEPLEIYYHMLVHRLDQRCCVGRRELYFDERKFDYQRGSKFRVMARCIVQE